MQPGRVPHHRRLTSAGQGFTLIELLTVVAIIAVLAAILFPVFSRARASARHSSCLSNLRQLSLGLRMYVDDHSGLYPFITGGQYSPSTVADVGLPRDDAGDRTNRWDAAPVRAILEPYTRGAGVWYCPALPDADAMRMESGVVHPGQRDVRGAGTATDYQINAYIVANSIPYAFVGGVRLGRPHPGPVSAGEVLSPSKLRLFQDFWNEKQGVHFGGVNAALADGSAKWQRAEFGITNVAWWAP